MTLLLCVFVLLSIVCHLDMLMWLHRRGTQQLWRAWDTSKHKGRGPNAVMRVSDHGAAMYEPRL